MLTEALYAVIFLVSVVLPVWGIMAVFPHIREE
jgi:hypothetical protein